MNIEQVCAAAIEVVERYLDSDVVVHYADIFDELCEAKDAVDDAWDLSNTTKQSRICRAAWNACLSAKTDHTSTAKMYVDEYWEQV